MTEMRQLGLRPASWSRMWLLQLDLLDRILGSASGRLRDPGLLSSLSVPEFLSSEKRRNNSICFIGLL